MGIKAIIGNVGMRAYEAFLSMPDNPQGRGSIYQPKSLTAGQRLMYNKELTEMYGPAYTAFLGLNKPQ